MIEYPVDQLPQLIDDLLQCDTTTRKNKLLADAKEKAFYRTFIVIV